MKTFEQPAPIATDRQGIASLALDHILPMTPAQYAAKLIEQRWGIEPAKALLVDLNYDFYGYPAIGDVHLGKVRTSQSLVHALLRNYQTVGAGRFGETAFGLYTPPATGPMVRIVDIDESINPGGGFRDYEGIYRQTAPQRYGPDTQLALQPAEFKQWVWRLEFKDLYRAYVRDAWPEDTALLAADAYPLRTAVKAAFVMAAWLQHRENSLSAEGLALALGAAGLSRQQTWDSLTVGQMQVRAAIDSSIEAARLSIYRYLSTDIWSFKDKASGRIVLYVPGNSSPFQEFSDPSALHQWVVEIARAPARRQALAAHFAEDDREDGTFHAGVLTALEGMATYPRRYRLKKGHGFFNNDGYWPAHDYIHLEAPTEVTDPFTHWVQVMKQAAEASVDDIRDDAQVNRDNLSAVVEPVVQWINRFAPLALFVPGGESLLALAGLIDAGYGLEQAVAGKTPDERSAGVTRTVFGLLNALPVAGAAIRTEESGASASVHVPEVIEEPLTATIEESAPSVAADLRLHLLRGLGPEVESLSDEALRQIGHVCDIDNELLQLMQEGRRPPTPILADTIARFRIDREVQSVEQFQQRYAALQRSDHAWVKLFQQHYPGLPKNAIEQILDRAGVNIGTPHTPADATRVLSQMSSKARQYALHVRLTRAYEGLYLRSVASADSDVLALHSLQRLPGWSLQARIELLDSASAKVVDSIGPQGMGPARQLFRQGSSLDFQNSLLNALTPPERSALGLHPDSALQDLQLKLRESALPRAEFELGLQRMEAGMPFDSLGLRGGGFPNTAQGETLSLDIVKLQFKELYPGMTAEEVEACIKRWGTSVQTRLASLNFQLYQLRNDLSEWIEQVEDDAEDLDIELLEPEDEEAQGMSLHELEYENDTRISDAMAYERQSRVELATELEALWQRRSEPDTHVYVEGELVGFRLNLDFDQLHSLPQLSVKLQDVVELSFADFELTQRESLTGFLESFPHLRTLDLQGTDLRIAQPQGGWNTQPPEVIYRLTQLTHLNLRGTGLTLTEQTAGKLGELTRLEELDLSENPLDVPPMVLQMPALRRLNLRSTEITVCPVGVHDQPYLQRLDLRDNLITRIPEAVRKQSVSPDILLLAGNPLSDVDTLHWVVAHRQLHGFNVWMGPPSRDVLRPDAWLVGFSPQQTALQASHWQSLVVKEGSGRFFGTLEVIRRTADFQVGYAALQQRVWRMVEAMDASPALCDHIFLESLWSAIDGNDPLTSLAKLEERIADFQASNTTL
ncbi:leucine Rich Repeat (LRR)-containing protein [Pseudomonas sp. ADAK2]|uniref:dermonecrotic toxin domain-containing protein n=1 Tax=unclassified Pseudomonas TaxID=196821 RepID=UPI001463F579|nr:MULTISPECIES: DUF6543 domain-containing protein [unclassified Pseudomonas]QJI39831.1 leucine Rich Repeat (LRR)-containing protein [Pseudomonas sp. ADAK7]QJI46137.1 leucine Rich Repeat (LRR)-containing protein [Pseudomonas sp. ADAK2]